MLKLLQNVGVIKIRTEIKNIKERLSSLYYFMQIDINLKLPVKVKKSYESHFKNLDIAWTKLILFNLILIVNSVNLLLTLKKYKLSMLKYSDRNINKLFKYDFLQNKHEDIMHKLTEVWFALRIRKLK